MPTHSGRSARMFSRPGGGAASDVGMWARACGARKACGLPLTAAMWRGSHGTRKSPKWPGDAHLVRRRRACCPRAHRIRTGIANVGDRHNHSRWPAPQLVRQRTQ